MNLSAMLGVLLTMAQPTVALEAVPVDALDRVFPDRWPEEGEGAAVHVPRNACASFQVAVRSESTTTCAIDVGMLQTPGGEELEAKVGTYHLLAVPVEANNNGGSKTAVGVEPRANWMASFIRKAPFEVAEVMVEAEEVALEPGRTEAVLVEVSVAGDAEPGRYSGAVTLSGGGEVVSVPLIVQVHDVTAPDDPLLDVHFWFWPEPENLTNVDIPEWWSERHWQLLEESGRTLRDFGQDTILTPLVNYPEPLIRTTRHADGSYSFDYTRFDRWVRMYQGLGFTCFAGHHILMLPNELMFGGVWCIDEATGDKQRLVPEKDYREAWLEFIPSFYDSLQAHLDERGWNELYIQHQYDEPKDGELYRRLAAMTREHLPRVRTMDAINSQPATFSPLVDMQVFALSILGKEGDLAEQRRANGQSVWLYHCCSPYPPYPNRHLDERLPDSRLYPWLAHMLQAEGYLYWGANIYRGADPYKTSVGPVPGGSQDPGHPPGDNWFYYPSADGLIGSLRQVAFRDGLLDHALLGMLAERDAAAADEIVASIARTLTDYETEPRAYNRARRVLLEAVVR